MQKNSKKTANLAMIIGIIGLIAGIVLLFSESRFIGIFGSIASAGLIYKGYQDSKGSNT